MSLDAKSVRSSKSVAAKNVHFSTLQNKPIKIVECLKGWKDKIMMNECVPKYFNLDIPNPSQAQGRLKKTKPLESDEQLNLTEREKEHLQLKRERCFQLILSED